jgi:prepilin-type N-terminal cleavage/methylation domain-containing protein
MRQSKDGKGLSLLELVVVMVIIAIMATVGLPRASRGARDTRDSALTNSVAVLRHALDLYAAEHGGSYPAAGKIEDALTLYSDASGATSRMKTTSHIYGPYLREIPPLSVGAHRGKTMISTADGLDIGWIYNPSLGTIQPNTTDAEKDAAGKLYNSY